MLLTSGALHITVALVRFLPRRPEAPHAPPQ